MAFAPTAALREDSPDALGRERWVRRSTDSRPGGPYVSTRDVRKMPSGAGVSDVADDAVEAAGEVGIVEHEQTTMRKPADTTAITPLCQVMSLSLSGSCLT